MRAVEIERRRAKLDQIRRASDLDEDQQKLWAQGDIDRAARGGEALEFLERLRALGNVLSPRVGRSSDRFHSLELRV
jgi:hypothetical protein